MKVGATTLGRLTSGSNVAPSPSPETMRSAASCRSTVCRRLWVADVRITLTPVIRARPTIRAAAVIAVRREAFAWAWLANEAGDKTGDAA